MRRLAVGIIMLGWGALASAACTAATEDGAVTGEDQNLEELPCKPLATIACSPGYTTISLLNCASGEGRCTAGGGCELETTLRCVAGYVPTSTHCKGKNAARCVALDAGAADASDASHLDASASDASDASDASHLDAHRD